MQSKVQYAKQRWGATLFYVDSDLDYKGNMTPAAVFQQLAQTFPGTMYFPEWKTPRDYAYTYGFLDSTNGVVSPVPLSMNLYPHAAGLIRVPDDANIGAMQNTLIQAVSAGNILLFDGWYRHPGNDVVSLIYALPVRLVSFIAVSASDRLNEEIKRSGARVRGAGRSPALSTLACTTSSNDAP